jgi:sarcosine oxidase subunit alpha
VAPLGPRGPISVAEAIACDLVLMSAGVTPSVHLFSQSRGKLRWDDTLQAYLPTTSAERERSAGACRGVFGLQAALADGYAQGEAAVRAAGCGTAASRAFAVSAIEPAQGGMLGAVPGAHEEPAFVDFQNDVTTKDLALAVREGFRSVEHVKRYTTAGMATDQGKTSNMNALGIMSQITGAPIPEIGLTTFRMPYTPVTFGTLAGPARHDLFDPVRCTPIHDWAREHGAVFEDVGSWKRAHYFPRAVETMHAAVQRECAAVRNSVGLFDASTLGKIEVVGPDAAEFLNRMYVNSWDRLAPGRLRYGVMLREDGFVLDDGVVARLARDRFHVTTTTGGVARVLHMMEDYLQTEWPDLKVWLTSTTEQWAVIAVQGPRARDVIAPLIEGVDLSTRAMPHMSFAEGRICGVPMRLFRVSFTGELGYEINVPADYGRAVWEAVFAAGAPHGITPYGTETMHVLRAEKGYIIVGQETDGTATPNDVGLGWTIGKAKKDFVGKRSLARPAMAAADRRQLVGLLTVQSDIMLEEGAQIVADPSEPVPMTILGHVTSSYWSVALGRSIALGMVKAGRSRIGTTLHVPMPDRTIAVQVAQPLFYDPSGARLHA